MTGDLLGPPDAGEQARRLANAQARARRSLQASWDADAAPVERFTLIFDADWARCGEMMAALGRFALADVSWSHDPPVHRADFSCTFATLKSLQSAALGTGVPQARIHFQRAVPGEGAA